MLRAVVLRKKLSALQFLLFLLHTVGTPTYGEPRLAARNWIKVLRSNLLNRITVLERNTVLNRITEHKRSAALNRIVALTRSIILNRIYRAKKEHRTKLDNRIKKNSSGTTWG